MKRKLSSMMVRIAGGPDLKSIARATATLLMGTAAARVVGVLTLPVLSRIYSPADFGFFVSFTAILTAIAPLVTLRFASAIPLVRTEQAAGTVAALAAFCLAGTSILLAMACGAILYGGWEVRGIAPTVAMVTLLVAAYILSGLYEIQSNLAIRHRLYKKLASVSIRQSISTSSIKIFSGLLSLKPEGLIIGHVLGLSSGLVVLWKALADSSVKIHFKSKRIFHFIAHLWQFPVFRLPSQLLLAFSAQMPILFAASNYDISSAGHFGVAISLLNSVIGLAAISFGQAFYGEIASVFRTDRGRVASITFRIQIRLLAMGSIFSLLVFLFSPSIIRLFLGNDWKDTGIILAYLAPFMAFQFASTPVIRVMDLIRAQWIFLTVNLIRFFSILIMFYYVMNRNFDIYEFSIIYSFTMTLFYMMISIVVFAVLKHSAFPGEKQEAP